MHIVGGVIVGNGMTGVVLEVVCNIVACGCMIELYMELNKSITPPLEAFHIYGVTRRASRQIQ